MQIKNEEDGDEKVTAVRRGRKKKNELDVSMVSEKAENPEDQDCKGHSINNGYRGQGSQRFLNRASQVIASGADLIEKIRKVSEQVKEFIELAETKIKSLVKTLEIKIS